MQKKIILTDTQLNLSLSKNTYIFLQRIHDSYLL